VSEIESMTPRDIIAAPWGKQVELLDIVYEGGLPMIRVRIKEGKRFTMLDLDKATAERIVDGMSDWIAGQD